MEEHHLNVLAGLGQRIEQRSRSSRVKRCFGLFDPYQWYPSVESGWLEKSSQNPSGPDCPVGHARRPEYRLLTDQANARMQLDKAVALLVLGPREPLFDPGATGFRGAEDGGEIGVHPLLVCATFARQGPNDVGQMFSVVPEECASGLRFRLPEFVKPEAVEAHAPKPAEQL